MAIPDPNASQVWGSARNRGLPLPLKSPELGHEIGRTRFYQYMLALLPLLNTQAVSDSFFPRSQAQGIVFPPSRTSLGGQVPRRVKTQTGMHHAQTTQKYTVVAMLQPHYQLSLSCLLLCSTNSLRGLFRWRHQAQRGKNLSLEKQLR